MRFVIAPDSYKGSLTAAQAAEIMERAVLQEIPEAHVRKIPMADGGEGTVDALVTAANGHLVPIRVKGPLGAEVDSYYGVIGDAVVLEAANVCGLTMVPPQRRNPLHTTSYGLGEAIRAALDRGFSRFIIGLGGSATNDGGMGMLAALGAGFTDRAGKAAAGFGGDLLQLGGADFRGLDPRLQTCRIKVACDVRNPLLGADGASRVYGPQKGASAELALELDAAMGAYAAMVEARFGSLRDRPGAGAAGGLGFALLALGAELVPGAQVVEEMTGLRAAVWEADWVLTGEGQSDGQTLFGKLPLHVAGLAREEGAEAVLISGSLGADSERLAPYFAGCFSIVDGPSTLQQCIDRAEPLLYERTRSIVRLIARAGARSSARADSEERR